METDHSIVTTLAQTESFSPSMVHALMTATSAFPPIFDGHNDTLLKLVRAEQMGKPSNFFERLDRGHIDMPRAREGGFAGGLFAMFVPSNKNLDFTGAFNPHDPQHYAELSQADALQYTLKMISCAFRLERSSQGALKICRSAEEIRHCIQEDTMAMSLHIEGAEAIDVNLEALDTLHAAGLRSLGPVWSRKNAFADGVPMAFNSSPDTGTGLTEAGKNLVKTCNELGILIDLSHITEKGFWDVAALSDKPLVASHSNAHALCPHARNLTDKQLDAIRESGGLVGLNFHIGFLRKDGAHNRNTPLSTMVDHLVYLVDRLGEDGVALGSDFDGCMTPNALPDASALPHLIEELRTSGFGDALINKIAYENWIRVLENTQR